MINGLAMSVINFYRTTKLFERSHDWDYNYGLIPVVTILTPLT